MQEPETSALFPQGLRLHPDWELVVAEGDQILINSLATSGDPDFMAQWDRMLNNREGSNTISSLAHVANLFCTVCPRKKFSKCIKLGRA